MEIQFVTSIAVISPDPGRSRQLYLETFGLPLADESGSGYFHSEEVEGTRHFGIWPLSQAAQACFGQDEWPEHLATPQVSIEFEVAERAPRRTPRPRGRSSASPSPRTCTEQGSSSSSPSATAADGRDLGTRSASGALEGS
jgi:hypothetical protein